MLHIIFTFIVYQKTNLPKAKQRQVEQQNRLVAMAKDLNNYKNLINHMKDEKAKMCSQLGRFEKTNSRNFISHVFDNTKIELKVIS